MPLNEADTCRKYVSPALLEAGWDEEPHRPLPYLLCQMNLLLHGLERPNISPENSLGVKLTEIGNAERVDVILTNPPFGGEEERGILANFPHDKQTTETALLFLLLIMRKLRRGKKPGRAGIVLPDGILSQAGIAARVREDLIDKFNLHTVIRLPRGVFEPYTRSSTSLLFFDAHEPSDGIWFYEVRMREGIKAYTQHRPFLYEELLPCLDWWGTRVESENAWLVPRGEVRARSYALNIPNPRTLGKQRFAEPEKLLQSTSTTCDSVLKNVAMLSERWQHISAVLENADWPTKPFAELAEQTKRAVILEPDMEYPVLAMSWYAKGLYVKYRKLGQEIKAPKLYEIKEGDFVYNRLFAWKGSFAEAGPEVDGCVVSNEFPCFLLNHEELVPGFLWAYFAQPAMWEYIEGLSTGTTSTSRLRLKEAVMREFPIPLPPKSVQREVSAIWLEALPLERSLTALSKTLGNVFPAVFERAIPPGPNGGAPG